MKNIMPKGLYAVIAENLSNGKDNITIVKEMLDAGIKVLQYRDKYKTKLEKFKQCEIIRKMTLNYDVFFIVNDDVDIALAVQSDGLHLGQYDLPLECAKSILGQDMIIGISAQSTQQALAAQAKGADYIGVGPIYKTLTKEEAKPVGLNFLDFCTKNINIPKAAIGGINFSNLSEVCKLKPDNICMISALTMSENIKHAVTTAKKLIDKLCSN